MERMRVCESAASGWELDAGGEPWVDLPWLDLIGFFLTSTHVLQDILAVLHK